MSLSGNKRVGIICASVAVAMLGAAYAAVPLYRLFCQTTGFNGATVRAAAPSDHVIDRKVTVRFDANVAPGLDWEFTPVQTTLEVALGENTLAFYRATNRSDRALVGSASFNVTPEQAGGFFNKIECFCFTEQRLEPGETVEMPVSFYVDPAIVKDPDGARVSLITLSYTFYAVANPKAGLAARTTTGDPASTTRSGPPAPAVGIGPNG